MRYKKKSCSNFKVNSKIIVRAKLKILISDINQEKIMYLKNYWL